MFVGILRLDLLVPGSDSLKDKRRVTRSLIERLRRRFGVSAAEVDGQGLWQRAIVGTCFVSGEQAEVQKALDGMIAWVSAQDGVELTSYDMEIR